MEGARGGAHQRPGPGADLPGHDARQRHADGRATQAGALEVSILPTAWVAPLAPSVQVLDLPFLFPDRAMSLYRVIDGPTGGEILKPLQKVNIEGVTFFESGFKQFTGNFPIRRAEDYSGHKIRTMPAQVIQEQFKAFGATPVTVDFKELYSALQQRVVDGQENPIATIALMRFFEVQKYLTLVRSRLHRVRVHVQQAVPRQAAGERARDPRRLGARGEPLPARDHRQDRGRAPRDVPQGGIEIIKLTPEQRGRFEQASRPVYDWYTQKFGPETLDLVRKDIQEK